MARTLQARFEAVVDRSGEHHLWLGSLNRQRGLAVADAAELLGISRAHAYRLVASGDLPSVRLGRRVLIPASAVRALAA